LNKITSEQLKKLKIDPKWTDALNYTFEKYSIDTPIRQAAFIGQCLHESKFSILEENLNYSKEALCRIWPNRFPNIASAEPYHRKPEKIANKVYSSRMGNGAESTGEGWQFRGRGLIQLTGKTNYELCSLSIGEPNLLVAYPDLVCTEKYACLSAGWFWNRNALNYFADKKDWINLTKKINGGLIGLEDRIHHIEECLSVLQ
jgi:putative chitinase